MKRKPTQLLDIGDEAWLPVIGFPGFSVSSEGRVKRDAGVINHGRGKRYAPEHVLARTTDKDGYLRVGVRRDGKMYCKNVHRLVLEAFVGPCPEGMQACHGDGDPANPRLSNLRWDTPSNNNADKLAHGTAQRGLNSPVAKLTPDDVSRIGKDARRLSEIAADFGVSETTISRIRLGKTWSWLTGIRPTPQRCGQEKQRECLA